MESDFSDFSVWESQGISRMTLDREPLPDPFVEGEEEEDDGDDDDDDCGEIGFLPLPAPLVLVAPKT